MVTKAQTVSVTLGRYVMHLWKGLRSVIRSLKTAMPYMLNVRSGEMKKEVTEQYPDPVSSRGADELPARSRGLLFNDIERCTGCHDCEKACPVSCISVETELGSSPNKVWVSVYDIDFSRCTFCGLCVESCLPGSLTHTRKFEGATYSVADMVASFGRGRVTPEQRNKWAIARQQSAEEDEE